MFSRFALSAAMVAAPLCAQPPLPFDGMARSPQLVAGDEDAAKAGRLVAAGATTVVRLLVASDGRPVSCGIAAGSGDTALDARACRTALMRFRYEPAIDGRGGRIAGSVSYRFRWR